MEERVKRLIAKLEQNNMQAHYVETRTEVVSLLEQLLKEGDTVAIGGSVTLDECGVLPYLRSGRFQFLDRYEPNLSPEELQEIYRRQFGADVYLCGCNAVTESGELYNVDGNSNRIPAIAFGPKSVVMVVGVNKIVKDIDEAVQRVKTVAAPQNCKRLNCQTPCAITGECAGVGKSFADGCGKGRICCNALISSFQRHQGRIKVVLVNEHLGF